MSEETKHVPYNTAPMSLEEREKELANSGSGVPLSKDQLHKPEKKANWKEPKEVGKKEKTPFDKQKKNAKKANKSKAKLVDPT